MKKLVGAMVVVLSLGVAQAAHAALIMTATINGVDYCAVDNNTGCAFFPGATVLTDTDAAANSLAFGVTTLGGITFEGATIQSTYGPPNNILASSFLTATNNSGATVTGTVAIGATGFTPPVTQANISASMTTQTALGSTVRNRWWNDPANAQGAESPTDTPGTLLGDQTWLVTNPVAQSFAFDNTVPVIDLLPFSMTLRTDFSLVNGGVVESRGINEIKPVAAVPEPGSMLLLGTGLAALASRARKRLKAARTV